MNAWKHRKQASKQAINSSIHQSINPSIHQSINPSIHSRGNGDRPLDEMDGWLRNLVTFRFGRAHELMTSVCGVERVTSRQPAHART